MARRIGTADAPPPEAARSLSVPTGEAAWEVHTFLREGASSVGAAAGTERLPKGTLVALPTSRLLVLPLWLQTSDAALIPGLVANQVEHLRPFDEAQTEWAWLPVAEADGKTLVSVYLLSPLLPPSLLVPQSSGYDFFVRSIPLPASGSVLFREEGGITLLCSRQGRLAYAHHFPGAGSLAAIVPDLAALARWLALENVVSDPRPLSILGEFPPGDVAAVESLFGKAAVEPTPPLRFPDRAFGLLPASLRTARREEAARRKRARFLAAAGLLYLCLLAAAGFEYFRLSKEVREAEAAQSSLAAPVAGIRRAADRWKALEPAINPEFYPMQALLAAVKAMPAEIRLTQFGWSNGRLLFAGEGKNAASIFAFSKSVQADPFLKRWTWAMPQPQILPNNRAQFQMEGTRGGAASDSSRRNP